MSRPLNFLHLTTFYPPYSFGGDAMYIYRLANALGDQGHQVDVIHCIDSYHLQHPGDPEIEYSEHPNVHRYGLVSGFGWLSPLLTQQTGRPLLKQKQIADIIRNKTYDVIQFHNISLLGPGILALEAENAGAVKMYMTHEHWLICPMHVLWKFNSRPCEKPECLACTIRGKRPPQIWRYTGMLAEQSRHVDQFVSPSRFTVRMHSDRGFPAPVAHLPYFIDRSDQDWLEPGPRPQDAPYFLFVGRLERIKGVHLLIKIWERIPDFDLLIVGGGKEADELRSQAKENPRIQFLGPRSQRELGNLYFYALATIVPSITYETFGIIVVESFARKTPVIVNDLGALPEIIADSGGGMVYNSDVSLLDAIYQIGNSTLYRSELGEQGYQAFLKYWTRQVHLELYFEYIKRIAEKKFANIPWE